MDRRLLNYLPPVLREVLEFQTINNACEPEISLAWDALTLVLANQFIEDADENGVAMWERELNIYSKDTDSLEARKARIQSMWNLKLPYTVTWLRNWLDGLCGPGCSAIVFQDYTLDIQLNYTILPEADRIAGEILDMLRGICPANVLVKLSECKYFSTSVYTGAIPIQGGKIIWEVNCR